MVPFCSANTEVYDFIGQVFPDTNGPSTGDADLDRERQELKEMGGITYENVKKLMHLPDLDDMDYDPEGTYMQLTSPWLPQSCRYRQGRGAGNCAWAGIFP